MTGVQPERQKVMLKGAILDNNGWDKVKLRDNAMVLMMGTKDEDMPTKPVEATKFIEVDNSSYVKMSLTFFINEIPISNLSHFSIRIKK